MKKFYLLLVATIIGMIAWLVIDVIQNKAEAESQIRLMQGGSSVKGGEIDIFQADPSKPRTDWSCFFYPRVKETPIAAPARIIPYMLTGTIVRTDHSVAMIRNTANNFEDNYKVGSVLDNEWKVMEIVPNIARIRNLQSETVTLKIGEAPAPLQSPVLMPISVTLPVSVPVSPQTSPPPKTDPKPETPRGMPGASDILKNQIYNYLLDKPREEAIPIIIKYTKFSEEDLPPEGADLAQWASKAYGISDLGETFDIAPDSTAIMFSTTVNPDNSPANPQSSFLSGDRRLYACFSSQGAVAGLNKVFVRWTNITTGVIENFNALALNPAATYNFVWYEKKDGWLQGEYKVELFKTQTTDKVAEGVFTITR